MIVDDFYKWVIYRAESQVRKVDILVYIFSSLLLSICI